MSEITANHIIDFLKSVSEDSALSNTINPQNEDGTCLYSDNNGNHCIVGYWFVKEVGIDEECLGLIEGDSALNAIERAVMYGWISSISKNATMLLSEVQSKADTGSSYTEYLKTWGEAIGEIDLNYYAE